MHNQHLNIVFFDLILLLVTVIFLTFFMDFEALFFVINAETYFPSLIIEAWNWNSSLFTFFRWISFNVYFYLFFKIDNTLQFNTVISDRFLLLFIDFEALFFVLNDLFFFTNHRGLILKLSFIPLFQVDKF